MPCLHLTSVKLLADKGNTSKQCLICHLTQHEEYAEPARRYIHAPPQACGQATEEASNEKAAGARCLQLIESSVLWPWFCDCPAPEMSTPLYPGQKPPMLHLLHVWASPEVCPFPPRNHRAQAGLGNPFIWLHAGGVGSEHCWRRQRQRAGGKGL